MKHDEVTILNAAGKPIVLNEREKRVADVNQTLMNALGYEINITTLTTIVKKVSEQKFFQIAPADYVPVTVGNGAWGGSLMTYRSFELGDDFSTGVIGTGGNGGRLAQADAGVDGVPVKIINWAKEIGWSLFDLQQAAKAGNWDLVTAKEKARKRNWDLGIQKVAFLGMASDSSVLGLYTQAGITTNTTLITGPISAMSESALNTLLAGLIEAYRANCNRTTFPTHFTIPESDYNGLASVSSATFPLKTKIQLLEEAMKLITRNPNFKIQPCAYGDSSQSGLGVQRYVLHNYDEESLRMDIPVDYSNTLANSTNNFSFQSVGYGQFTGVQAYRPLEMLYLQY